MKYQNYVDRTGPRAIITKARGIAICYTDQHGQCTNMERLSDSLARARKAHRGHPEATQPYYHVRLRNQMPLYLAGQRLQKGSLAPEHIAKIPGSMMVYEYEYGAFFVRISEFEDRGSGVRYLQDLKFKQRGRDYKKYYIWNQGRADCSTCAKLTYDLDDYTRIVSVYPNDGQKTTAFRIMRTIEGNQPDQRTVLSQAEAH